MRIPPDNVPPGLSIIVATGGPKVRPSLQRTLASIVPQLAPGDELLVDVNDNAPWGHRARNRMMGAVCHGNGLVFMDDDDTYAEGGLAIIRDAYRADPDRVHIFCMTYHGGTLWREPRLVLGNVSTQMVCVPGPGALFSDRYAGDFDFMVEAVGLWGEPIWHPEVVAHYRP